jgi:hypothetical protein
MSRLLSIYGSCDECDWTSTRRNAQGVAALHHDRTGHRVRVRQTRMVVYG